MGEEASEREKISDNSSKITPYLPATQDHVSSFPSTAGKLQRELGVKESYNERLSPASLAFLHVPEIIFKSFVSGSHATPDGGSNSRYYIFSLSFPQYPPLSIPPYPSPPLHIPLSYPPLLVLSSLSLLSYPTSFCLSQKLQRAAVHCSCWAGYQSTPKITLNYN